MAQTFDALAFVKSKRAAQTTGFDALAFVKQKRAGRNAEADPYAKFAVPADSPALGTSLHSPNRPAAFADPQIDPNNYSPEIEQAAKSITPQEIADLRAFAKASGGSLDGQQDSDVALVAARMKLQPGGVMQRRGPTVNPQGSGVAATSPLGQMARAIPGVKQARDFAYGAAQGGISQPGSGISSAIGTGLGVAGFSNASALFHEAANQINAQAPQGSGVPFKLGAVAGQMAPALSATMTGGATTPLVTSLLSASSFGSGVQEYRNALLSRGEQPTPGGELAVGLGFAAVEYITERIGIDAAVHKVPGLGNSLKAFRTNPTPAAAMQFVNDMAPVMLANTGEELAAQGGQNLIAQAKYDPNRPITQGMVEAGLLGAAGGAMIAAPGAALNALGAGFDAYDARQRAQQQTRAPNNPPPTPDNRAATPDNPTTPPDTTALDEAAALAEQRLNERAAPVGTPSPADRVASSQPEQGPGADDATASVLRDLGIDPAAFSARVEQARVEQYRNNPQQAYLDGKITREQLVTFLEERVANDPGEQLRRQAEARAMGPQREMRRVDRPAAPRITLDPNAQVPEQPQPRRFTDRLTVPQRAPEVQRQAQTPTAQGQPGAQAGRTSPPKTDAPSASATSRAEAPKSGAQSQEGSPSPQSTREPWQMTRGEYEGQSKVWNHQTWREFSAFDMKEARRLHPRRADSIDSLGFWFTDAKNTRMYGPVNVASRVEVKNPYSVKDTDNKAAWSILDEEMKRAGGPQAFREKLIRDGHDGVVLENTRTDMPKSSGESHNILIAFDPAQIEMIARDVDASAFEGQPTKPTPFSKHRAIVEAAHAANKPVPPEVLAEYGIKPNPPAKPDSSTNLVGDSNKMPTTGRGATFKFRHDAPGILSPDYTITVENDVPLGDGKKLVASEFYQRKIRGVSKLFRLSVIQNADGTKYVEVEVGENTGGDSNGAGARFKRVPTDTLSDDRAYAPVSIRASKMFDASSSQATLTNSPQPQGKAAANTNKEPANGEEEAPQAEVLNTGTAAPAAAQGTGAVSAEPFTRTDGTAKDAGTKRVEELRATFKTKRAGWHFAETDEGATLIHPTEDRVVRFKANQSNQRDRARTYAQAFADDNPVKAEQTAPGELKVQELKIGGEQQDDGVRVADKLAKTMTEQHAQNGYTTGVKGFGEKYALLTDEQRRDLVKELVRRKLLPPVYAKMRKMSFTGFQIENHIANRLKELASDAKANREAFTESAGYKLAMGEQDASTAATAPQPAPAKVEGKKVQAVADDIPTDVAERAFSGTSHMPEKRAQTWRSYYVNDFNNLAERFRKLADTDELRAAVEEDLARFRDGLKSKYLAYLGAHSRVMSSMITGPARFPVEANRKRMDSADKRLAEIVEFVKRADKSITKRLFPQASGVIRSDDANAPDALRAAIEARQRRQEAMKEANKIVRKGGDKAAMVTALEGLGFSNEEARRVIYPQFQRGMGFPGYALTNNNKEIRRLQERLTTLEAQRAREPRTATFPGGKIVENADAQRVQITFPSKPDEKMRESLKSRGFKWAPSEGAWQRLMNEAAWRSALLATGATEDQKAPAQTENTDAIDAAEVAAEVERRKKADAATIPQEQTDGTGAPVEEAPAQPPKPVEMTVAPSNKTVEFSSGVYRGGITGLPGVKQSIRAWVVGKDGNPTDEALYITKGSGTTWDIYKEDGFEMVNYGKNTSMKRATYKHLGGDLDLREAKMEAEAILRGEYDPTVKADQRVRPIGEHKYMPSRAWSGTIPVDGLTEFVTDGRMLMAVTEQNKRTIDKLKKTPEDSPNRMNKETVTTLWNDVTTDAPKKGLPATIFGAVRKVGNTVAYLKFADGYVSVQADRLRLMLDTTKADRMVTLGERKPLVFYKGSDPVGILMPLNRDESFDPVQMGGTGGASPGTPFRTAPTINDRAAAALMDWSSRARKRFDDYMGKVQRGEMLSSGPPITPLIDLAAHVAFKALASGITSKSGRKLTAFIEGRMADIRAKWPDLNVTTATLRRQVRNMLAAANDDREKIIPAYAAARERAERQRTTATGKESGKPAEVREAVANATAERPDIAAKIIDAVKRGLKQGRAEGLRTASDALKPLIRQARDAAKRARDMANIEARGAADKATNAAADHAATEKGIRAEAVRLVQETPIAGRRKYLSAVANASKMGDLARILHRLRGDLAKETGRHYALRAERLEQGFRKLDSNRLNAARLLLSNIRAAYAALKDKDTGTAKREELADTIRDHFDQLNSIIHEQRHADKVFMQGRAIQLGEHRDKMLEAVQKQAELPKPENGKEDREPAWLTQKIRKYADFRTLMQMLDRVYDETGIFSRARRAMEARRTAELAKNQEFIDKAEKIVQANGYKSWSDFMARTEGAMGDAGLERIKIDLGAVDSLTVGQAMAIYAQDAETKELMHAGQPWRLNRNGDTFVVDDYKLAELESKLTDGQKKIARQINQLRSDMQFERADGVYKRITGNHMVQVVGHYPRKRILDKSGSENTVDIAKLSMGEWAVQSLENSGFTIKRVQDKKTPLLLEDFGSTQVRSFQGTEMMIQRAEMVKYLKATLFNPTISDAIAQRYGGNMMKRLTQVVAEYSGNSAPESDKWIRKIAANTARSMTQVNPGTWLRNLSTVYRLPLAMLDGKMLGAGAVLAAIPKALLNWRSTLKILMEHSPDLRHRWSHAGAAISMMPTGATTDVDSHFADATKATIRQVIHAAKAWSNPRNAASRLGQVGKGWGSLLDSIKAGNAFDAFAAVVAYHAMRSQVPAGLSPNAGSKWAARKAADAFMQTANTNDLLNANEWQTDAKRNTMTALILTFTSDIAKMQNLLYLANKRGGKARALAIGAVASSLAWSVAIRYVLAAALGDDEDKRNADAASTAIQELVSLLPAGSRISPLVEWAINPRGKQPPDILDTPLSSIGDNAKGLYRALQAEETQYGEAAYRVFRLLDMAGNPLGPAAGMVRKAIKNYGDE